MKFKPYKDNSEKRVGFLFLCPGCKHMHSVNIEGSGLKWTLTGTYEQPTIRPSLMVKGFELPTDEEQERLMRGEQIERRPFVCHSYITEGKIHFLNDCTHALAGKVTEPDEWGSNDK